MGKNTMTLDTASYLQLQTKLTQLSKIEKEATIKKGLQEGLDVIVRQGKMNLASRNQVRSGNLSHSFKKIINKSELKGYAGFSRPKGSAAHLVDKGTQIRSTRKGANRGRVIGTHFWEDAKTAKETEAQNTLMESVKITINRIINK